jgi:hypothetical protein
LNTKKTAGEASGEHVIDRVVKNIEYGRFERMMSGLTTFGAAMVCAEVYYEHYKASFGNKFMWSPVVVTPPIMVAGVAGVFSKRAAKTILPISAAIYALTGIEGLFFHARGIMRKPGGLRHAWYNIVMGPPAMAPMLFAMVGGMGLLASLLRREK